MKRLVEKVLIEVWTSEGNQEKMVKLQRLVSGRYYYCPEYQREKRKNSDTKAQREWGWPEGSSSGR